MEVGSCVTGTKSTALKKVRQNVRKQEHTCDPEACLLDLGQRIIPWFGFPLPRRFSPLGRCAAGYDLTRVILPQQQTV